MSPEYNDFILSTAYWQGWLTVEQYHAAKEALEGSPATSALDLLRHNQLVTPEQIAGLEEAVASAQHKAAHAQPAAASTPPPVPTPTPRVATPTPRAVAVAQPVVVHNLADGQPAAVPRAVPAVVSTVSIDNMGLEDFLRIAYESGASDVHVGVGAPPLMRRHGSLVPLFPGAPELRPEDTIRLWKTFLLEPQVKQLLAEHSLEFSYAKEGLGRYRVSIIHQRKGWSMVFRIINTNIRTMAELGLPDILKLFTQYHNGLVLVTGAVGTGKSTTLASMVQEINMERHDHIITLEDPIEYVFQSANCQVTQREVHSHTMSFGTALRASLREDPDVIIVGEMRDLETISLAITAAETGHLVLATLHTGSAARTLDRVLDAFPVEQQGQIRTMVSESLRGIVSQQLVPRIDGKGRALALEILVNTPAIANIIRDAKTYMLPGQIQIGRKLGMRLMDDSLLELVQTGVISGTEAYDRAEQKKLFEDFT